MLRIVHHHRAWTLVTFLEISAPRCCSEWDFRTTGEGPEVVNLPSGYSQDTLPYETSLRLRGSGRSCPEIRSLTPAAGMVLGKPPP
jgi:hypothetical protein